MEVMFKLVNLVDKTPVVVFHTILLMGQSGVLFDNSQEGLM
jgi:hypothetical protein